MMRGWKLIRVNGTRAAIMADGVCVVYEKCQNYVAYAVHCTTTTVFMSYGVGECMCDVIWLSSFFDFVSFSSISLMDVCVCVHSTHTKASAQQQPTQTRLAALHGKLYPNNRMASCSPIRWKWKIHWPTPMTHRIRARVSVCVRCTNERDTHTHIERCTCVQLHKSIRTSVSQCECVCTVRYDEQSKNNTGWIWKLHRSSLTERSRATTWITTTTLLAAHRWWTTLNRW